MPLCGTCAFAPARAATCVAAKTARVPHGPKATCIHGWLACAFVKLRFTRLRSANPFFRSSPPSMPHYHAAGGRRSKLATLAPPAVKDNFNTIQQQSVKVFNIDIVFPIRNNHNTQTALLFSQGAALPADNTPRRVQAGYLSAISPCSVPQAGRRTSLWPPCRKAA